MNTIKKLKRFDVWLKKLKDTKAKITIVRRIERLRDGNAGDCKSLGESVFELRITVGPGYRVYFTKEAEKIIIIMVGGDKSTQKRDIELAKKIARRKNYDS